MSPLIHLIVSWLLAIAFLAELRDRRIVVLSGIIADVDAVFILFSQELFIRHHHGFGHSLVFGIPFAIIATALFSCRKVKTGCIAMLAFSAHLLLDIVGTNWPVSPFWPFSDMAFTVYPALSLWTIYGIINPVFTAACIILAIIVVMKKEKSPMEFISVSLDRIFSGFFVYPFKYNCEACGKRASYHCEVCKKYYCARHVNRYFATRCAGCEEKG